LLSRVGITASLVTSKKASRLYISGRKNLEVFAAEIGFVIKRKQAKLKEILTSYKLYRTPTQEINKLIPQMTKLRARGPSYRKIAALLEISHPAVRQRLLKI